MKKYIYVILSFLIILSYQNCAPYKNIGANNYSNVDKDNDLEPVSYNKISVNQFKNLSMSLSDYEYDRFIDANIETGELTPFEKYGDIRCKALALAEEDLLSLQKILYDAQVCEPIISQNGIDKLQEMYKDRVCALSYTLPYAILGSGQEKTYRLGEKTSACEESVDLCENKSTALKEEIKKILSKYKDQIAEACQ